MKLRWLAILACSVFTACSGSSEPSSRVSPKSAPESETPVPVESKTPPEKSETPVEKRNTPALDSLTPAEHFAALVNKFDSAMDEFITEYRAVDENARTAFAEKKFPNAADYADDFMKLAADHPDSDVAFDSLNWVVSNVRSGESPELAYDKLFSNYRNNEGLKNACMTLSYSDPSPLVESRLNLLIETSPHDSVKAAATYALASYLSRLDSTRKSITDNPDDVRYSEETLTYLQEREVEPMAIEALYQNLIANYPQLKLLESSKRTYQSLAEGALFEMHRLAVGMVAPEIEGDDLDGVTFKLSDYRGKVVVLDFWGDWCGSCRARYPHERSLIKQLADLPFVVIGVNSDDDLDSIREIIKTKDISWRSFWNGPDGTSGSISTKWNVTIWPTIYLIDGEGKIRFKNLTGKQMDEAITVLLGEMGHEVELSEWSKLDKDNEHDENDESAKDDGSTKDDAPPRL